MKPSITLWDAVGAGIIIEMPTGVVYSNQTGGHFCLQPTMEGAYASSTLTRRGSA